MAAEATPMDPAELKRPKQPGQSPAHQKKIESCQDKKQPEQLGEEDKFIQLGHGREGEEGDGWPGGRPAES